MLSFSALKICFFAHHLINFWLAFRAADYHRQDPLIELKTLRLNTDLNSAVVEKWADLFTLFGTKKRFI
jgi:hypothetical protein